jgi:hypothetical protein
MDQRHPCGGGERYHWRTIEAAVLISTPRILCKKVQISKLTETHFFQLVWTKNMYNWHYKKELRVHKWAQVANSTPEVAEYNRENTKLDSRNHN